MPAETTNRDSRVDDALAEYLAAGPTFDRSAWLVRYADVADDLAEFLDDQAAFAGAASPLMAVSPACGSTPPISPDGRTLTHNGSPSGPVAVGRPAGTRFGDYELLDEIARGGMGVVYRARQVSLNRVVALKLIRAGEFADAADVKRFRTEAEAAAHLDHPNLVPIHEVGEYAGQQFYAMRLVEGGTLAGRVGEYSLAIATTRVDARHRQSAAVALIGTVARAVHYAHQRGVLHRDLKPANILLGQDGTPFVTDFGLARRIGKDSTLTKTGAIVGTPSYMAPEQARGREDVTTEADVYGLGAVLYHLLAGRPPFLGEDVLDTLYQVREREPARPRAVCREVDLDLETVCLKCLEKDPGRRYQSAAALADDLDRWRAGEPVVARRAGAAERAWKWARRNPAGAGLIGLGALAAGAMIWVLVALSYNAELAERKRLLEETNGLLEEQKQEADRLRGIAETESARATEQERRAQRILYVTQMNQAQKAWEEKKFGHALALLDKLRPQRPGQEDLRGPEWHHLWRECGGSDFELLGHTAGVTAIVFSSDGKMVASGDAKGWIRLWNVARQRETHALAGHTEPVSAIAFSPDGRRLASSSLDRSVRVWDAETGRELVRYDRHMSPAVCVGWHPAGNLVASGEGNGSVHVWQADSGTAANSLPAIDEPVQAFWFNPRGDRLVAFSEGAAARVLTVPVSTNQRAREVVTAIGLLAPLPRPSPLGLVPAEPSIWVESGARYYRPYGPPSVTGKAQHRDTAICIHPNGDSLAVGRFFNRSDSEVGGPTYSTLEITPLKPGGGTRQLKVDREPIRQLAFSGDGRYLAAGTVGSRVRVYSVSDGLSQKEFQDPAALNGLALSPMGDQLVTAGEDGVIRVRQLREKTVLKGGYANVAFSRDGRQLVAKHAKQIWSARSRKELRPNPQAAGGDSRSKSPYGRIAISPDGRFLSDGNSFWDLSNMSEASLGTNSGTRALGIAFSPDGRTLAVADGPAGTSLYEVDPVRFAGRLAGKPPAGFGKATSSTYEWATSVAFSPDGRRLAIGYASDNYGLKPGQVQTWDVESRQLLRIFDRHTHSVWDLAFSPDGKYLAGACGNYNSNPRVGEVKVWEMDTGREVHTFGGYPDCLYGIAFSPDGQRLATASGPRGRSGGEIRVWDLSAGQQVLAWPLTGGALGVAYSPDGSSLAYVGHEPAGGIWGPILPDD